jgi:hypothetical protein
MRKQASIGRVVARIHNVLLKCSQWIYRGYEQICLKTRNRCSAETPILVMNIVGGCIDIAVLQYVYTVFGRHRLRVFKNSFAVFVRGKHHVYIKPVIIQLFKTFLVLTQSRFYQRQRCSMRWSSGSVGLLTLTWEMCEGEWSVSHYQRGRAHRYQLIGGCWGPSDALTKVSCLFRE